MRKLFTRLAIAPLAFAVSMAASAAPGDMPSASQRAAMQRDLGMTSAQLSQYLKVERLAAQQSQSLAAAQGRNYAGSWIERGAKGDYRLVVATTSAQPQRGPANAEFRSARHSLAQLDAAKGELDLLAAQAGRIPAGIHGCGSSSHAGWKSISRNEPPVSPGCSCQIA